MHRGGRGQKTEEQKKQKEQKEQKAINTKISAEKTPWPFRPTQQKICLQEGTVESRDQTAEAKTSTKPLATDANFPLTHKNISTATAYTHSSVLSRHNQPLRHYFLWVFCNSLFFLYSFFFTFYFYFFPFSTASQ